jgi:hypothetical protein
VGVDRDDPGLPSLTEQRLPSHNYTTHSRNADKGIVVMMMVMMIVRLVIAPVVAMMMVMMVVRLVIRIRRVVRIILSELDLGRCFLRARGVVGL